MRRTYVRSEKYIVYHFEGFVYRGKNFPGRGRGRLIIYSCLGSLDPQHGTADQFEIPSSAWEDGRVGQAQQQHPGSAMREALHKAATQIIVCARKSKW